MDLSMKRHFLCTAVAAMLLTAIAVHAARTSSTVFDNLIAGWSADVAPFQSFFQHEHFGKAWKQIRADLKKQLKRKPAAVEIIFLGCYRRLGSTAPAAALPSADASTRRRRWRRRRWTWCACDWVDTCAVCSL